MESIGKPSPRDTAELLARYARGERNLRGAELDGVVCDLRGATLAGADLSLSFLVADLRGADLRDADFTGANLKTCDFRNADLRGARFRGALLEATEFAGAQMDGADFAGASCYSRVLNEGERPDC
jgi:uncharacterized protein YjbI with pentapeptide repeats